MALLGGKIKFKRWHFIALILLLTSAFVFYIFYFGLKNPDVLLDENEIKINGASYSVEYKYVDIIKIDTVSVLPEIYLKTNGFATSNVLKGHFKMAGIDDAVLFVDTESAPFIFLEFKDNKKVFVNFKDRSKTLDLYNKIESKLK